MSTPNTYPNAGTGSPDPAVRRLAEAPKLDPQQVPPAPIPGAVAKNEALYVILGLLIPGLPALLLKDDKATGGIQLGLWVVSWILAIFLFGFVLWIGVAIWSAMDGYQAAKLWNSPPRLRHLTRRKMRATTPGEGTRRDQKPRPRQSAGNGRCGRSSHIKKRGTNEYYQA